jgi:ferredoxin-thioredoxin reductase catalytic chain
MNEPWDIDEATIDRVYRQLDTDAKRAGYNLNPDEPFTRELVKGLIVNSNRYGYFACPCRLATGTRAEDRDIICPCDYRDADLEEYGACYCGLYVSKDIAEGKRKLAPVPERRPPEDERRIHQTAEAAVQSTKSGLPYPVWRCRVCGYLCARKEPPGVCPICKADKDRFELFMAGPAQLP